MSDVLTAVLIWVLLLAVMTYKHFARKQEMWFEPPIYDLKTKSLIVADLGLKTILSRDKCLVGLWLLRWVSTGEALEPLCAG